MSTARDQDTPRRAAVRVELAIRDAEREVRLLARHLHNAQRKGSADVSRLAAELIKARARLQFVRSIPPF